MAYISLAYTQTNLVYGNENALIMYVYIHYDLITPFDKNNLYDYTFDDTLSKIIRKYRCSFYMPDYDENEDIITIKIKIKRVCPISYTYDIKWYQISRLL